jgi:hypothetical protein
MAKSVCKHSREYPHEEKCHECGVLLCMSINPNKDTICTLEKDHIGLPHVNKFKVEAQGGERVAEWV